jgi:hypothetical protein
MTGSTSRSIRLVAIDGIPANRRVAIHATLFFIRAEADHRHRIKRKLAHELLQ